MISVVTFLIQTTPVYKNRQNDAHNKHRMCLLYCLQFWRY